VIALVPDARRELFGAMCRMAETGTGPAEQQSSMGCSITMIHLRRSSGGW
jgi:hypothetical protein